MGIWHGSVLQRKVLFQKAMARATEAKAAKVAKARVKIETATTAERKVTCLETVGQLREQRERVKDMGAKVMEAGKESEKLDGMRLRRRRPRSHQCG